MSWVRMKRSISRKMSREEVIASMANKLADGSVVNTKRKVRRRIIIINLAVILSFGTLVFSVSFSKKSHQQRQSNSYLQTASMVQSPLLKLKTAFQDGTIGADEYALYLTYLLVKYDSVPEIFQTPRPHINATEINAELDKTWNRLSMGIRKKIRELLPQFRSQGQ